uniref:rRNA-processing protein FYV7 n=1 Tax=Heterorhabditis bacteriophora TaxID=37862 RepID=A0A1I7XI59_HETBA
MNYSPVRRQVILIMSSILPKNVNNNMNKLTIQDNNSKNIKPELIYLPNCDYNPIVDNDYDNEKIQLRRDKEDEYLQQLEEKVDAAVEQLTRERTRIYKREREDRKLNIKKSINKKKKHLAKLHEKEQERRYQVRKQIKFLQKRL